MLLCLTVPQTPPLGSRVNSLNTCVPVTISIQSSHLLYTISKTLPWATMAWLCITCLNGMQVWPHNNFTAYYHHGPAYNIGKAPIRVVSSKLG